MKPGRNDWSFLWYDCTSQGCRKGFYSKKELENHERVSHSHGSKKRKKQIKDEAEQPKETELELCKRRQRELFALKVSQIRRKQEKSEKKTTVKLNCYICSKFECTSGDLLDRHKDMDHVPDAFKRHLCKHCPLEFVIRPHLAAHVEEVHGIAMSEKDPDDMDQENEHIQRWWKTESRQDA